MRYDTTPFFRSTVGFDHLFDLLESASDSAQGYPPYNIERSDDTHYRVSVAVVSSNHSPLSQLCGTCGVARNRSRCFPRSSG